MSEKYKLKINFILLLFIFLSGIIVNMNTISAEIDMENEENSLSEQTLNNNIELSKKLDIYSNFSSMNDQSRIDPSGLSSSNKITRYFEPVPGETVTSDDRDQEMVFNQEPVINPQIGDILAYGNPNGYYPFSFKWEIVDIISPEEVVISYTEFNEAALTEYASETYILNTHTRELIGGWDVFPYWMNPDDLFIGAIIDIYWLGAGDGDVFADGIYNYYGEYINIWIVSAGYEFLYYVKDTGVLIGWTDYDYNPYWVGTYINVISPADEIHNIKQVVNGIERNQTSYVIPVFIQNTGHFAETFDVEVYANSLLVTSRNINLNGGEYQYLELEWDPELSDIYFVEVITTSVTGETYLTDNYYSVEHSTYPAKQYEMNICPIQWYSTSGGYNLGLSGDDVSTSVDLEFEFLFYDRNFSTIYVGSNGWLSFTETTPIAWWSGSFPSASAHHVIAPFWIDLVASNNIHILSTPDYIVIEYNYYFYLSGSEAGTFQVVLYSSGDIVFQYLDMESDLGAVVGLNYGFDLSFYTAYTAGLSFVNNFALGFSPMEGTGVLGVNVYGNDSLEPIANAQVDIYNEIGNKIDSGFTDIDGFYKAVALDAGDYRVEIVASGYYSTSLLEFVDDYETIIIYFYLDPLPIREVLILSPTEGQTVEGGVVYIEFATSDMNDVVLVDMFVDDIWITNVTSLYSEFICVPIFENGTNLIRLEFLWADTGSALVEISIESVDVIPLYVLEDGDYFILKVEFPDIGVFMEQIFTFVWYSEFEINVSSIMRMYDVSNTTIDQMHYYVRVNILNGYITDSDIPGFIHSHFALFNRITNETDVGDPFISSVWSDIAFITGSMIWRGKEVWTITLIGGILLYIDKESGLLIYEEIPDLGSGPGFGFVQTNIFELDYDPYLSSETDYSYDYGTTGHLLTWNAYDEDPAIYEIYKDGELVETDTWYSGVPIIHNIDNLAVGSYNYTIVVVDEEGCSVKDTVMVTVNPVIPEYSSMFGYLILSSIMCITLAILFKKRKSQEIRNI